MLFAAKVAEVTLEPRLILPTGAALAPILNGVPSVSLERTTVTLVVPPTATVRELGVTVKLPVEAITLIVAVTVGRPAALVDTIVVPAANPRTVTDAKVPPAGICKVAEAACVAPTINFAMDGDAMVNVIERSVVCVLLILAVRVASALVKTKSGSGERVSVTAPRTWKVTLYVPPPGLGTFTVSM